MGSLPIPRALLLLGALPTGLALGAERSESAVEIARREYRRGAALYEAHAYSEAAAAFEAARRAKSLPALDFNIGRCYEKLEQWPAAIEAYRRYLATTPTPADALDLQERITRMQKRMNPPLPLIPPRAAAPLCVVLVDVDAVGAQLVGDLLGEARDVQSFSLQSADAGFVQAAHGAPRR
jgi:tetratricopeptide (TPR) repeat protein